MSMGGDQPLGTPATPGAQGIASGGVGGGPPQTSARRRFDAKWVSNDKTGCWEWTAHVRPQDGYGAFAFSAEIVTSAHRAGWLLYCGPIPKGMQLDHLCRNRACVNPAHLEVVTPRENTIRSDAVTAQNARKVHCKHGHELSGDNLIVRGGRRQGQRECRACKNESWRRRRGARAA